MTDSYKIYIQLDDQEKVYGPNDQVTGTAFLELSRRTSITKVCVRYNASISWDYLNSVGGKASQERKLHRHTLVLHKGYDGTDASATKPLAAKKHSWRFSIQVPDLRSLPPTFKYVRPQPLRGHNAAAVKHWVSVEATSLGSEHWTSEAHIYYWPNRYIENVGGKQCVETATQVWLQDTTNRSQSSDFLTTVANMASPSNKFPLKVVSRVARHAVVEKPVEVSLRIYCMEYPTDSPFYDVKLIGVHYTLCSMTRVGIADNLRSSTYSDAAQPITNWNLDGVTDLSIDLRETTTFNLHEVAAFIPEYRASYGPLNPDQGHAKLVLGSLCPSFSTSLVKRDYKLKIRLVFSYKCLGLLDSQRQAARMQPHRNSISSDAQTCYVNIEPQDIELVAQTIHPDVVDARRGLNVGHFVVNEDDDDETESSYFTEQRRSEDTVRPAVDRSGGNPYGETVGSRKKAFRRSMINLGKRTILAKFLNDADSADPPKPALSVMIEEDRDPSYPVRVDDSRHGLRSADRPNGSFMHERNRSGNSQDITQGPLQQPTRGALQVPASQSIAAAIWSPGRDQVQNPAWDTRRGPWGPDDIQQRPYETPDPRGAGPAAQQRSIMDDEQREPDFLVSPMEQTRSRAEQLDAVMFPGGQSRYATATAANQIPNTIQEENAPTRVPSPIENRLQGVVSDTEPTAPSKPKVAAPNQSTAPSSRTLRNPKNIQPNAGDPVDEKVRNLINPPIRERSRDPRWSDLPMIPLS